MAEPGDVEGALAELGEAINCSNAVIAFLREERDALLKELQSVHVQYAATPALLAAAKRALNFCLNSQSEVGIAPESDDEMEVTKLLRAAIAKAEPS